MSNTLYQAFKEINIANLDDDDKEQLLQFFIVTTDSLLRNQIAFMLSDLKFQKVVPFIIQKINQKELLGNNGSLVYALENLDVKDHFLAIVQMICDQEYESRLNAFGILQQYSNTISESSRIAALEILEKCKSTLKINDTQPEENGKLHFIEKAKELLLKF